jgi:hypothetical protein
MCVCVHVNGSVNVCVPAQSGFAVSLICAECPKKVVSFRYTYTAVSGCPPKARIFGTCLALKNMATWSDRRLQE